MAYIARSGRGNSGYGVVCRSTAETRIWSGRIRRWKIVKSSQNSLGFTCFQPNSTPQLGLNIHWLTPIVLSTLAIYRKSTVGWRKSCMAVARDVGRAQNLIRYKKGGSALKETLVISRWFPSFSLANFFYENQTCTWSGPLALLPLRV